jgi:S-adenosylmethionine-diacylglycerol 3-amino-3-carboxypropyl transferase
MPAEIAARIGRSQLRYAQCWEDADVLLAALAVRPGDVCLSIASAGDNALALLVQQPARVIAVDVNPCQIACLELRVAAYRQLSHPELLELIGSAPSAGREALYRRCRPLLSPAARGFWDARPRAIAAGIGGAGRFERYLALFRRWVLPLLSPGKRALDLLEPRPPGGRADFYRQIWDTWRWRILFRLFFSRWLMGRVGRDPRFFDHVDGQVAARLLERARHALTTLDPSANPYLQWILTGRHPAALPLALRPEHFDAIRTNLDRLEWHCAEVEEVLETVGNESIDRFNLSDIFEYMSPPAYAQVLGQMLRAGRPGARLVYWNLLVDRHRPDHLADRLRPLGDLARRLHAIDKAFFYADLVIEEVSR